MKKIRNKRKLVWGIGINDSDYAVQPRINGKGVMCPFYTKWVDMLRRCYSKKQRQKYSSYIECYVTVEWLKFSVFKAWMETQDWQGKELDKDILFPGNKMYGPESCVFVDSRVNSFLIESNTIRGDFPIGVCYDKRSGKYLASCRIISSRKQKHLGYFTTPEEAHKAWLAFKLEQAKILASEQTDKRVEKALIDRYENYNTWNLNFQTI